MNVYENMFGKKSIRVGRFHTSCDPKTEKISLITNFLKFNVDGTIKLDKYNYSQIKNFPLHTVICMDELKEFVE